MNPQLTCSQRQWLHSSVGRASHRYREVLNFFQASLRNCINCVHCNNHFFIFINFSCWTLIKVVSTFTGLVHLQWSYMYLRGGVIWVVNCSYRHELGHCDIMSNNSSGKFKRFSSGKIVLMLLTEKIRIKKSGKVRTSPCRMWNNIIIISSVQ